MERQQGLSDLTVRDFLSSIFRQKFVIIIVIILIMAGSFVNLKMKTPVYTASVKMYIKGVTQTSAETYRSLGAFRIHMTQMVIVKSDPVLYRVVMALKLDQQSLNYEKQFAHKLRQFIIDRNVKKKQAQLDAMDEKEREEIMFRAAVKKLRASITTALLPHTDIFTVTVRDYDPHKAIEIANVVSRSYLIFDQQQQLNELSIKYGNMHPSVQQLKDSIRYATRRLSGEKLPDIEAIGTGSVKIVEQARSSFVATGKSTSMVLLISLFVGVFAGVGLALIFDFLNNSIKEPQEITNYLNLPVLGTIPQKRIFQKQLLSETKRVSRYSQFYNELAEQLYIFMKIQTLKSIMISGIEGRNRNSKISYNLAFCLSNTLGHKTLLIDVNLRQPYLHKIIGIPSGNGFSNISDEIAVADVIANIGNNLDFIQAGQSESNPLMLWGKLDIDKILKEVESEYEAIIVDGTNVKSLNDNALLYPHIDGVALVVNEGRERRHVIKNTIASLKDVNANIIGGVLNNRTFVIPGIIYKRL